MVNGETRGGLFEAIRKQQQREKEARGRTNIGFVDEARETIRLQQSLKPRTKIAVSEPKQVDLSNISPQERNRELFGNVRIPFLVSAERAIGSDQVRQGTVLPKIEPTKQPALTATREFPRQTIAFQEFTKGISDFIGGLFGR